MALLMSVISESAGAQGLTPTDDCSDVPGTKSIITGHRIIMIGESHGTREMPATFERLVCAALQRGENVSVGLEMPSNQREPLADYMASDGSATARKSFLASTFWAAQFQFQDGRRSGAYFDMVESLRAMRRRGLALTVFVLEDENGAAAHPQARDKIMAANVRRQHQSNPDGLVMTFSGNIHNMLKIPQWLPNIPSPMGAELRDMHPVSINLTAAGGTTWNCQPDCGVHGDPPAPSAKLARQPALILNARAGEYSGYIDIGYTTASPPAAATKP